MKRFLAGLVLGLLTATPGVEAGWLKGNDKLPKPAPPPILRGRAGDSEKAGHKANHPGKYQRSEWGAQWKYLLRNNTGPHQHALFTR